jgi:hypothetical protein
MNVRGRDAMVSDSAKEGGGSAEQQSLSDAGS